MPRSTSGSISNSVRISRPRVIELKSSNKIDFPFGSIFSSPYELTESEHLILTQTYQHMGETYFIYLQTNPKIQLRSIEDEAPQLQLSAVQKLK